MTLPEPIPPSFKTRLIFLFRRLVKPVTLERRAEVQVQLREASRPDFDFFLLVVLSCMIATLGLLTNSAAVIIGGMLVAPLMSPIIGLGLASLTGDAKLLRDAGTALGRGALIAVLIAALLALGNRYLPFITLQELPQEVLARTRPSPIDLTIALAWWTGSRLRPGATQPLRRAARRRHRHSFDAPAVHRRDRRCLGPLGRGRRRVAALRHQRRDHRLRSDVYLLHPGFQPAP